MPRVTAPYNFVPLNENVFFPPWAEYVSHDVPFKNGLSGSIDIEITAESPIFIRKPYEVDDEEGSFYINSNGKKTSKMFCHIKKSDEDTKKHYIPGSSIKGEIISVLENLSFSKLRFINEKKYSQRDWDNDEIYKKQNFVNVKGGWLEKTEKGYKISYSSRNIGRISHIELDKKFDGFSEKFSTSFDAEDENQKTALYKYKQLKELNNSYNLLEKDKFNNHFERTGINRDRREIYSFYENENNSIDGTIVVTGQSSVRTNNSGKLYEFIFWEANEEKFLNSIDGNTHELIQNFFDTYKSLDNSNNNSDFQQWKNILEADGKVPIFITLENNEIKHFGLSMLYRLLYKNSIKDLLPEDHKKPKADFTETLFGSIKPNQLKSRVQFSHAFASKEPEEFDNEINMILGSPKASFYPYYLEQNFDSNQENGSLNGNYFTYDDDGKLSGRKRYPIVSRSDEFYLNQNREDIENSDSKTTFIPLKKGVKFNGSIKYHNLLPEELGGLLSALTFHNNNENYYHSLGMAKPYSFGVVKIKLSNVEENFLNEHITYFEKAMVNFKSNWIESEQLKELFAMATKVNINQELLSYLKLDPSNRINDFSRIKKEEKGLYRYSRFMSVDVEITSVQHHNNNIDLSEFYNDDIEKKIDDNKNKITQKIQSLKQKILEAKQKLEKQNTENNLHNILTKADISTFNDLKDIIDSLNKENLDEKAQNSIVDILQKLLAKKNKKFRGKDREKYIKQFNWIENIEDKI